MMTTKCADLEAKLKASEAECEDYKYDLKTLVSLVHDCVHNTSQDECFDILKEIDSHYTKLKEQENEKN